MNAPEIGSVVDHYRLDSVLGRGGTAVVYAATDLQLGRQVAVKILSPDLAQDAQFRERFTRESRVAASIDHPHIVPLYEAGEWSGHLFIAMRLVDGTDLRTLIRREGRLDTVRTVSIVSQVASALDEAHHRGLIHRDVKPANVLVVAGQGTDGGDHAYLSDFGLTKPATSNTQLTNVGVFVGTADYVAPEQIQGEPVDHRVDVYSLGCLMYECLTGHAPFQRDSEIAVMFAHVSEPPPQLMQTRPDVGMALSAVVARAMAKSRDERFATCGALAAAARAALDDYVPCLIVRDGLLAGHSIRVDADVLLGRDDTEHPLLDPAVSRRHALVRRDGRHLTITDLGSRNGTWVNGRRVTGMSALDPGDAVVVGATTIDVGADTRGRASATIMLERPQPPGPAGRPTRTGSVAAVSPTATQPPGAPAWVAPTAGPPPAPPASVPPAPAPPATPPPAAAPPAAPPAVRPPAPQPPRAGGGGVLGGVLRAIGRVPALVSGPRAKWVVVAVWVVAAAAMLPFASKLSDVTDDRIVSFLPASAQSAQANDLIRNGFPGHVNGVAIVVYHRAGGLTDADKGVIGGDAARLASVTNVVAATPPFGPSAGQGQVAQNGEVAFTVVPLSARDQDLNAAIAALRTTVGGGSGGLEVHVTGAAAIESDLFSAIQAADSKLLVVTAVLVISLLLLIYRAPAIALIPIVVVGISYSIAGGIGYLWARAGLPVTSTATSLLLVLMFGAGTDYCLLVVSRHVDFLQRIPDKHSAVATAARRVGPAVIASGFTVISALLVLLIADLASTRTLGPMNSLGIAVMLLSSQTLLPAVLAIVGRKGFWPMRDKVALDEDAAAEPMPGGLWRRIGDGIVHRPIVSLVVIVAVLGAGALGLSAYNEKASALDAFRNQTDATRGYDVLKSGFPEGTLAPVTVVVQRDGGRLRPEDVAAARAKVAAVADVGAVSDPIGQSTDGTAAAFNAVLALDPYSNEAFDRVDSMRAGLSSLGAGVHAFVGGQPAVQDDYKNAAHRDLRVLVPLVLVVILVVLVLLLRALVAPLLLIASVILSFFGIIGITLEFFRHVLGQDGFDPNLVIFSFIFLVALGVDYNIFLMDRVRYESERHGTRAGVRLAVVATGPVITGAGLILAGTFAALTSLPITILIELGAIVAFGVLIDTLFVRTILVPSVTVLLGDRIWWPARLRPETEAAAGAITPVPAELALPGRLSGVHLVPTAPAPEGPAGPAAPLVWRRPGSNEPIWTDVRPAAPAAAAPPPAPSPPAGAAPPAPPPPAATPPPPPAAAFVWSPATAPPEAASAAPPPPAAAELGAVAATSAPPAAMDTPAPTPAAAAARPADAPPRRATLRIVGGPDTGRTFEVAEPVELGSAATAQVRISDRMVSRRHARVSLTARGVEVEDLRSTNGTAVDGRRITEPTVVPAGGTFQIGLTIIAVASSPPADPSAGC